MITRFYLECCVSEEIFTSALFNSFIQDSGSLSCLIQFIWASVNAVMPSSVRGSGLGTFQYLLFEHSICSSNLVPSVTGAGTGSEACDWLLGNEANISQNE